VGTRLGWYMLAGVAGVLLCATGAAAAAPGLPRGYDYTAVDSPRPVPGQSFGWGIASGDFTGDGEADLLVAQAQTGPGQVFVFDGVTGEHIDTIDPPEKNPGGANDETLAFVYVETMPDIGSCPGGDGADADEICDDTTIGPGDGIPEIITGSRNLKVNATDGSTPPVNADRNIGRAYVFDGATRAVLKRIDMPQADRMAQLERSASPQFGRLVMSLQGMAPCAGDAGENNGVGVGACPDLPQTVRIGDVNAGGAPDLVITARNFVETGAQAASGSQCRAVNAASCTSGKAWVYAGEDIAGSDPDEILETAIYSIQNPEAQTGGAEFGGNVTRVGDATGDGAPEFVIAARNLDYPLDDPDAAFVDVGAAFLYNGATGALMSTIVSPEPQPRSQFSASFNSGRPVGDLGASLNPDVLLAAPLQNALSTDDGKVWVFNAVGGGGGGTGSWQFASLTDATAAVGSNFGGATTGVGDLVEGTDATANEVLIGGFGFDPFTEATKTTVADLHIVNPTFETNLQTIGHPEGARGDGFGVGLAPMGDLNDDGFLDIAASAYLANVDGLASVGRAYILTSNDTPPPAPEPTPTPAPVATPTPTPAPAPPAPERLPAGACVNDMTGTAEGERLIGTLAGDNVFAMAGDDFVTGFQGDDCVDGGRGADRIAGGPDADRLLGRGGKDTIEGEDGRDRLHGGGGNDELDGGYGPDLLGGGSGRDVLTGGPDRDRLFGEKGRDRLAGGSGRDYLDGGPGRDRIEARDGERDDVVCGGGRDLAIVDRLDRVDGCERVRRGRRR